MTKYLALLLILLPVLLAGAPDRGWRFSGYNYWYQPDPEFEQNTRSEVFYSSSFTTQKDSIVYFIREADSLQWQPYHTRTYRYAPGTDNIVEAIFYDYEDTYSQIFKVIAEYDNLNRITLIISYSNFDSPDFTIPSVRYNYIYDETGVIESYYYYRNAPNSLYFHSTYQKDYLSRVLVDESYRSTDSLNWVLSSRVQYTYDASDNSTGADYERYLAYTMDGGLYQGNADIFLQGMITEKLYQEYTGSTWINSSREVIQYNALGKPVSHLNQFFITGHWDNVNRQLYDYDANGNLISQSTQSDSNGVWSMVYETYSFNWEQYTSNDEDSPPPERLTISAWPNPFRESINIILPDKSPFQLGIYNLKGQLVRSYKGKHHITWDGRDDHNKPVSAGMYFLRSGSDKHSTLRKVIKIK